jgi:hypothetical protein
VEDCASAEVGVLKLAYSIEVRRFEVSCLEYRSKIMGVGMLEFIRVSKVDC